jgi:hypothetical protein
VNLPAIRTRVYVYLGTRSTDPMYPATTVDALINAVANKYIADVHELAPSYLRKTATLTSATRSYNLPADFAGYIDVRETDESGAALDEIRDDDVNHFSGTPAFSITGPDQAAVLTTSGGVTAGRDIYLKYRYQPAELSGSAAPDWMPTQFHDLLAREAAIDAAGLGGEGSLTDRFIAETQDRRAQFWSHVGRRGVQPSLVR